MRVVVGGAARFADARHDGSLCSDAVRHLQPVIARPKRATDDRDMTVLPGDSQPPECKNIKLFQRFRACSIDFGQFAPMFRLDAARYRNAIS